MFTLIEKRYKLNCEALITAREQLKLSRTEFAYKCGWTYSYQWRLEMNYCDTISEGTKNIIDDVLKGVR